MQVSYTTTIDDYMAFQRHSAKKSPSVWALFLFGWLGIPAIAVLIAVVLFVISGMELIAIAVAALALLFAIIYPLFYRVFFDGIIQAVARERGTRGIIGPITLILSDERLVEITETTRSEVRWEDMKGVDVAGDYTFIFVTGLAAAIIPRHGFNSDEEYEAVRDFAIAKLNGEIDSN